MSDAPPPVPVGSSPHPTDALEERCREWYRDHAPAVYGYFRFHVPSIDVAEDLTAIGVVEPVVKPDFTSTISL